MKVAAIPALRVKLSISDVRPLIWRRVAIPGSWHLGQVHDVIQLAFGWQDYHPHEFERDGRRWGPRDPSPDSDILREQVARLHEVVPHVGDQLSYTYDFGDDWVHTLVVEELLPPQRTAACLGGCRAGPPEDSGGPWGYQELLAAIADPRHPEHEERLEWLDADLDPERFDLAATDVKLRRLG